MILPTNVIDSFFKSEVRESSGNLYPSRDLCGSLRHAQLRCSGVPQLEPSPMSYITMKTGSLWHDYLTKKLIRTNRPFMHEVSLEEWLPEGWSGRVDWLIWSNILDKFVLFDLKTTGTLYWTLKSGPKDEHLWQLSAYYWALKRSKIPVHNQVVVFYLPLSGKYEPKDYVLEPLPAKTVSTNMNKRYKLLQDYLEGKTELEKPIEDHWQNKFCPFPPDVCGCAEYREEE